MIQHTEYIMTTMKSGFFSKLKVTICRLRLAILIKGVRVQNSAFASNDK